MSEHTDCQPISPIYSQVRPNTSINLGELEVEFSVKEATVRTQANAEMHFIPDTRLTLSIPSEHIAADVGIGISESLRDNLTLNLPRRGSQITAFYISANSSRAVLVPTQSPITVRNSPGAALTRAVVHLFNVPEFFGIDDYVLQTRTPQKEKFSRCGRVYLRANGWKVTLAATAGTQMLSRALEVQGGYAITHLAEIKKDDGSTFSADDLTGMLECLHYFISFALGRWSGLAFPVAYDTENEV